MSGITDLQNSTALSHQFDPPKAKNDQMGKEEFLRLLMTQLKAQDPLNPQDSSEFVAQLSQFASLEQLTNVGQKMDDLVTISGATNAANAVSLLGKEVRIVTNTVTGPSKLTYELPRDATNLEIDVVDQNGRIVHREINPPSTKGSHEINMTGFDQGKYSLRVLAKDVNKDDVPVRFSVVDRVQSVNFEGNVPMLVLASGQKMKASDVIEVTTPRETSTPIVPPVVPPTVPPVTTGTVPGV